MDKHLFAFLKDRNIFNGGHSKGLKEALTERENKQLNELRSRKHRKKVTKK